MKEIVLKDDLHHKAYSWPLTLLSYEQEGVMPIVGEDVLLKDGVEIPYQAQKNKGKTWTLKFLSDLPTDGVYRFHWKKGKGENYPDLSKTWANEYVKAENIDDGLFRIYHVSGRIFEYALETEALLLRTEIQVVGGAVECELKKTLYFEDNRKYEFVLKIKRALDYVEIYEKMSGWKDGEARLVISWKNFNPLYRHSAYGGFFGRGKEAVDAYTQPDGEFPFVVNTYQESYWEQKCVAYSEKEEDFWFGLMLHDLEHFNDGEYAIWSNHDRLVFRLYPDKCVGGVCNGERAFANVFCQERNPEALERFYLKYYGINSLNVVKDWVLDWDDDKTEYPKYFKAKEGAWQDYAYFWRMDAPTVEDMMNILDSGATLFTSFERVLPVSCRYFLYHWAPVFDMTASQMTEEQFKRIRAAMAFTCYSLSSENYMPHNNALAGHPNFIADVVNPVGLFAALLGKKHPKYQDWLAYFETVTARNMKYHIRPDVKEWNSLGGRWTENIGCYMFAMLHSTVWASSAIYHITGGEMPLLYPHFKKLLAFLINNQNTENIFGRRLYSPHGAHSCTGEFGGALGHGFSATLLQLADMCKYYEPLYAEYLLYNYRKQEDFEAALSVDSPLDGESYKDKTKNTYGTPPDLYSAKYTGFGFMLRHHANSDDEMNVFLQQLDEGPNYRWGRAAQGGCGELFYYANRRKYTDHAPEDVGDENRGDVQACTNFGVLIGHEFKSVGRNDLTEPLMDFDFVQYARVNASDYSLPYYKYRSVMMVENRYIAVYDAVADFAQRGKFVWAQNQNDAFPNIWNIKPGVQGYLTDSGIPIDAGETYNSRHPKSREKVYDGTGDFFTIVSHMRASHDEPLIKVPQKQEYGCDVQFPARKDRIFDNQSRTRKDEREFAFDGFVGYLTEHVNEKRMAIFDGEYIRMDNVSLRIPYDKNVRHGMSMIVGKKIYGKAVFLSEGKVEIAVARKDQDKVFVDGKATEFSYTDGKYEFVMPQGYHTWNIGEKPSIEKVEIYKTVVRADGFTAQWKNCVGAENYEVAISSNPLRNYKTVAIVKADETDLNSVEVHHLPVGKYYVKVRGICGEDTGSYSHPYPVYVTEEKPHAPEGLRVVKQGDAFVANWGGVLGVEKYRLYQVGDGKATVVFEGYARTCTVEAGEYYVTAVNGNGESAPSLCRATDSILASWDNRPDLGFVRDTRAHEHGYAGFDYLRNQQKPVLEYPKEK